MIGNKEIDDDLEKWVKDLGKGSLKILYRTNC